jgi:phosphoserine phosphatase RsbU/P
VRGQEEVLEESAEELLEDAPCGYLTAALDGTILKVNRTFESWTGLRREQLVGRRRFKDLLSPGGRIYHETHYAPLLQMQGTVRAIAVEFVRADGSRLPALINSVLADPAPGRPRVIRTAVFDATDRRRYEQELLQARRREQDVAQQLQRSMLTGAFPTAPGLDIGVAYRPAVSGLEVGGDWYDAFWLGEDSIGLVVGDVVGRGIEAAVTMGQLRSATRALASTGLGPARLLEALDGYARRHEVGMMATVVYAEISLGSSELRFACAGHPPPVIAATGEEPRLAWEGRSWPLDTRPDAEVRRREAACHLPAGGLVALYTDGLVECRGSSIDNGMERLLNELRAHRDESSAALTSRVVRALDTPEHRDDVCLLAADLAGATP